MIVRPLILIGCASLLSFPQSFAGAVSLRDEATKYRQEGYERQQRGDSEEALTAYQKAAALDPSYATPHNDAGVLLEAMGRLEEAKQEYERALTIDPNYLEAHANLAMLHERLGEKEQAIYHWLKRYQLGKSDDAGTARAEERLTALGVLSTYPGLKGKIVTRRRVIEQELKAHDKSTDEFRAITEQSGRW
ncbi:MAG: tetratricopeptide repeat protein [Candidatus Omnitrophica bacterium]|nr:tetratricopeptide repeat protein [Candidatus Omnitrophota bacterium]